MKYKIKSALLALVLLAPWALVSGLTGCGSLDPAGVYHGDKTLYGADVAVTTAHDVLHTFLTWEHNNQAALAKTPAIHAAAEKMRANEEQWIHSAIACRDAYAAVPSPSQAQALQQALAVLSQAVTEASGYLVQATK